jgi:choline-sulfatase
MPQRPNILVIMTDQHSRHMLGCYGNNIVRTPHLDRLAGQGMVFRNAYCASPVCGPSRMSFLTGRTPAHNRVWHNGHLLNPATPTWAHLLGIAGYETSLLGRMHFEGHDQYHGFERRPIGEMFAVHPGTFVGERYPSGQSRRVMELSGRGTTTYQWMDERITEAACNYLAEQAAGERDRPFAAVIGYVLPHCPFVAPRELFDYYYERVDVPVAEGDEPAMLRWYRKSRGLDQPLPQGRVRIARAAYFALCDYIDQLIGRVLGALDTSGLSDDTLVVYCSDHGEMAGEHGIWTKNTYYEGSAGVPLIARLPGVISPGTSSAAVCSLLDLAPTLADVAQAAALPGWDGHSLWPAMGNQGTDREWPDEAFSEVVDTSTSPPVPSRMVRWGRWKLWVDQETPGAAPNVALFDLDQDPQELHDLAADPAHAGIRQRLYARVMDGWDPDMVRREAVSRSDDYGTIAEWGRTVKPAALPEQLLPPPASIEDDVEIL